MPLMIVINVKPNTITDLTVWSGSTQVSIISQEIVGDYIECEINPSSTSLTLKATGYEDLDVTVWEGDDFYFTMEPVKNYISSITHKSTTYTIKDAKAREDIATKQDALTTQTAYSAKGSSTKVPQITTNNLGQVTGITEVTISQPTVNNKTITIQKNSTAVDSFTLNQSTDKTINITVPAKTSDLTNDSGFLTSHQSVKTLNTNNTTAQTASSSEAIAGSGTINLHKVSKTGSYSDLLNKPTIPATNVIPTTTTANKVLVSTTTSGTAKWSDFSTAGLLKTNTSGVVSVDTTSYGTYSKPSGGIPASDLAESYYLASNPSGYTSNAGTVTSVRVQAGTGLASSTSTAQSTALNTTISVASGYKLPTTTEWGNKQDKLTAQTAYTSKGSATKVPQITTNTLGQVTGITEVTITQPTVNNATLTIQKNGTTVKTFTANASTDVTANITVPTKVSDLTNDSGFTTNTGTVTGVTAGAGLNTTSNDTATDGGTISTSGTLYLTKSGVTAGTYQGITVDKYGRVTGASNQGYTTNTGTVTSVRVQAGTGLSSSTSTAQSTTLNTTISIASGYKLPTATEWSGKQDALPSQTGNSGKFLTTNGSALSWASASAEVDNSTITKNGSDQIQTVGYKDVRTNNTLKTWTGTRAQYDAIATKDANTLYNITDDTDTTATMLELLYPVGAIYIGTMDVCPLATLGIGSWEKIAEDQVLQGSSLNHDAGTTIAAGLPNITGDYWDVAGKDSGESGAIKYVNSEEKAGLGSGSSIGYGRVYLDASLSNPIYGNSNTVQPPAFVVNIWRRIS